MKGSEVERPDMSQADSIDAVADALDDVGTPEPTEITAEDMDRLRRSLPTDPEAAKVVNQALPFPWGEVFEYVSPSDRQSGYWRVKAKRSGRSEAEREHERTFAQAAQETVGTTGTVERDGKEIPRSAAEVADRVQGSRFSLDRARRSGEKALRRLRSVLGG